MPESDRLDIVSTALAILACVLLCVALSGCSAFTRSQQSYEITGTLNGEPVRISIDGESQVRTTVQPDPAVMAQVAKAAADAIKAQIPGMPQIEAAIAAAAPKPSGFDGTTGGAIGAAGGLGLLALKALLDARSHKRDGDEAWERLVQANRELPPKGGA